MGDELQEHGCFFISIHLANGGYEIYKQKAVHRNLTSGTEVVFDLSEESGNQHSAETDRRSDKSDD